MRLDSLTPVLIEYRYWILIPLSLVEGPTVALITGSLSSRGYFNLYFAYAIFVVKDLVVDASYYYVGRFAGETSFVTKLLAKAHITGAQIEHVRFLWDRHGWRTMCIGKLSWGLSPAFLATAGIVAIPVAIFVRYALGIALVQYGVLMAFGYYFGNAISSVSQAIRVVGYIIAGSALVALVYVRRRLRA
jgi:membrane protein DedA with SNARE-associated domain